MKKFVLFFIIILACMDIYSQNGTYKCNNQRFENKTDPSKNKSHTNSMLITIDINNQFGGSILVANPSESFSYRWDILNVLDTNTDIENKTVYTSYEARLNVANGQSSIRSVAIIIQDMKTNSLHIAVDNPSSGTINWFHNLSKITN